MTPGEARYRLAAGTDVVRLAGGAVLLRSDVAAVRLDGASASLFADTILPLLDGRHSLGQVADAVPGLSRDDLGEHLDSLVAKRVLRRGDGADGADDGSRSAPFLRFLDALDAGRDESQLLLSTSRVAIFGLEAHGAHAAAALAPVGLGALVLVDPDPLQPANLSLVPGLGPDAVGVPRQEAVRAALEAQGHDRVVSADVREVGSDSVAAVAAGCDLVVACIDRGFAAANHWVNAASLDLGVPALYTEIRGTGASVGPLVLPGETACYLCWRMRTMACEQDFDAAMSYEEFLDQQRRAALHERAVVPGLPPYVGGIVAVEVLKHLLGLGRGSLAGRVHVFDAMSGETQLHTVLAVADCPSCQKHPSAEKKKSGPGPTLPFLS